jgi:hypothetical protein
MSRNCWPFGAILLVTCWPWLAHAADPAKICVPPAGGVPGRWSQPPQWWGTGPGFDQRPDEPRWNGALRVTHGTTQLESLAFRALFHPGPPDAPGKRHLYLSWKVEGDPFATSTTNPAIPRKRVVMGIGPDCNIGAPGCDASKFHVVLLEADGNGAAFQSGAVVKGVYRYASQGADSARFNIVAAGATLAWNNTSAAWLEKTQTPKSWTMQVRIPVHDGDATQGLPIPDDFRLFYREDYLLSNGFDVTWTWPRVVNDGAFTFSTSSIHTISPDGWGRFHLGQDGSAACQTGVTLAVSDIGTVAGACPADPAPLASASLTNAIDRAADNCFVARPRNQTGTAIGAGKLEASFRIANWGSMVDFGAWDDLLAYRNPRPQVRNQGSLGTSSADNVGVLSLTWKPETDEEKCLYVPGYTPASGACPAGVTARWGHQCIQVELKAIGADLVVLADSVSRNMDFIDASKSEVQMHVARIHPRSFQRLPPARQKEIIDRGIFDPRVLDPRVLDGRLHGRRVLDPRAVDALARQQAGARDVAVARRIGPGPGVAAMLVSAPASYSLFLWVERVNMGDSIQPAQWRRQYNALARDYQRLERSALAAPRIRPGPDLPGLRKKLPSFVVHVYRDTGHVIQDGDTSRKVFRIEPSFGAFVKAPRELVGWNFAIDGLESVGQDLFKLDVADTGDALVRVRLQARTPLTRDAFVRPDPSWRDVLDTRLDPLKVPVKPGTVTPRIDPDRIDRNDGRVITPVDPAKPTIVHPPGTQLPPNVRDPVRTPDRPPIERPPIVRPRPDQPAQPRP